ncbi:MAG: heparinase II/III family protein [Lentisphaeria bacterium]|nr:heparinase II/III family protein [Lentisphaeria bacterium]
MRRPPALPQKKVIRRGSIAIPERRHTYRIGSYDFASFGTAPHPRLKKLAQFNIFHDPALLQSLNADLKYQLPPDGEKFQPGADPAIRSRADWLRIYGARVTGAGRTLMRIGQYALVSGDPAAVAKAKELALAVVRNWDPEKASSRDNLDLAAGNLLMGLGFCYDAAYGIMTPEERKEVDEGLMIRGRQFWKFIHPFRGNEAQNHSWDNTHSFAFASVVCDSAPEERAVWFDYALQLYTYRFLPSLGFDGENNEGLAYWRFGFNLVTRYLDLARQAAGINLYALDYVRKTGNFGLYSAPLAGYEMSFGDNGTPNHHGIWTYSRALCRKLAIETASPEILWYASIPRSGSLEAQVPLAMAQSVTYPHIGVSFFNTFLPDARENVAVGFHSGKYFAGHQHADQNSFSINAYGDKLIVDGGYYDWWGSAHFYSYATTTRAHNTLLINGNGQAERAEGADGVTRYFADSPAFGYVCGDASNPAIYGGRLQKFTREMLFVKPDAVLTFDRVQAQPGAVWSYLLHAQGEKPVLEADGSFRINRQYAHLRGKWLAPAEVKVEQAYDTPPNDMLSSSMLDFHEKEWIIQADFKGENFLTAMEIRPSGKPAVLDFERRETPTAVGVSAQGLLAAFRRSDSGRFTLDGIVSDGRMAAVRTDASGNVIGALLAEGTFLEYRGKKLCQLAAAGNWSFPAEQSYSKEEKKESLTWNDAPIPAELHTVIQGDGSRSCLLSAKTVIPEDGYLTIHAPEMPHYIAGKDGRRYAGRAPRTHWVEKGEYLFSFAGAAAGKVKLQFVPAQFLAAKVLPESVVPGEGTVLLEAETPSAWEGEELYVIGRDFCSGGKFGFRFHQSDQNLIWHFAVKDPGQYRLVIAGASTMTLVRDLRLPDGRTVALKMPSSGGDGRAKEDWKWYVFPEILTLDAGENTLEMRFNHGIGALDAVFLIPVKQ